MNWKELRDAPDGSIFCECDLPSMPLYLKVKTLDDDLLVRAAYHPEGAETYRPGWREMDNCERNSKEYHALLLDERAALASLMIGDPIAAQQENPTIRLNLDDYVEANDILANEFEYPRTIAYELVALRKMARAFASLSTSQEMIAMGQALQDAGIIPPKGEPS